MKRPSSIDFSLRYSDFPTALFSNASHSNSINYFFAGVIDHVKKARDCNLPHVKFFDEAYSKNWLTPMEGPKSLMVFVEHLLAMSSEEYASQEWKYSEWASTLSTDPHPEGFGKKT